jgi:hypothetical protein
VNVTEIHEDEDSACEANGVCNIAKNISVITSIFHYEHTFSHLECFCNWWRYEFWHPVEHKRTDIWHFLLKHHKADELNIYIPQHESLKLTTANEQQIWPSDRATVPERFMWQCCQLKPAKCIWHDAHEHFDVQVRDIITSICFIWHMLQLDYSSSDPILTSWLDLVLSQTFLAVGRSSYEFAV